MNSFFAILKKETVLLLKDKMGLAFMILMPVILVILMTNMQDSSYKAFTQKKIKLLVINADNGIIGKALITGLDSSNIFKVYWQNANDKFNIDYIKTQINNNVFKIGIFIPKNSTKRIKKYFFTIIKNQLPTITHTKKPKLKLSEIKIFYNPTIKTNFKLSINNLIKNIISDVKSHIIFKAYTKTLKSITGKKNKYNLPEHFITINENSIKQTEKKLPTSSQHNVPAWTVFAIFFIVIPLSTNFIYEKQRGTFLRLRTTPTPFYLHLISKIFVFTIMSVFQALIIVAVGKYLFPLMNLPTFDVENIMLFYLFTLFVGIAATSYAVAIGVFAKTQHQASIFGSISVVIFAAFGGIWIPTFVMSSFMQKMSILSPLNWAISGYYKIILQNADFINLLPEISRLLGFASVLLILSSLKQLKSFE